MIPQSGLHMMSLRLIFLEVDVGRTQQNPHLASSHATGLITCSPSDTT